jgi:hypothetical protein
MPACAGMTKKEVDARAGRHDEERDLDVREGGHCGVGVGTVSAWTWVDGWVRPSWYRDS